jgi:hypothetical protein
MHIKKLKRGKQSIYSFKDYNPNFSFSINARKKFYKTNSKSPILSKSSSAINYLLYLFGRKTTVERMNRVEKQEPHAFFFSTNFYANELTHIARQLDSAIKRYR